MFCRVGYVFCEKGMRGATGMCSVRGSALLYELCRA